jgi:hypothetical protein
MRIIRCASPYVTYFDLEKRRHKLNRFHQPLISGFLLGCARLPRVATKRSARIPRQEGFASARYPGVFLRSIRPRSLRHRKRRFGWMNWENLCSNHCLVGCRTRLPSQSAYPKEFMYQQSVSLPKVLVTISRGGLVTSPPSSAQSRQ